MGDVELVTRTLQIEQKLFYLDLKDNPRGRYLKISEKTLSTRSTIVVPLAGIVWFVDLFTYYASGTDAQLSSKELQLDTKVFYFDVGENPRGRYLKVSEASMVRNRSTIIVPAGTGAGTGGPDDGWAAFRSALAEIHEASMALPLPPGAAAAAAAAAQQPPMPAVGAAAAAVAGVGGVAAGGVQADGGSAGTTSRVIRTDQKRFFLDLGSNARGSFLKISEVLGADRSSIIVPASAVPQLHEAVGQLLESLRAQGPLAGGVPGGAMVRTLAPQPKRNEG